MDDFIGRLRYFYPTLLLVMLTACQLKGSGTMINPLPKATASSTFTAEPRLTESVSEPDSTSCEDRQGRLVEGTYEGLVYQSEISYLTYLPPCYEMSNPQYPVIYLLHGYPYDQNHWIDLGLIQAYEAGLDGSDWPPVIFVFPFIPETLNVRTDGGVGSYEQEFLEGLMPAIEARLPVSDAPDDHVIGGVSRGGVWALEIGLRNTEQLKHVVAISPALIYNQPRPRYDPFEIIKEDRKFPETLFLSAAENETPFREEIEAFVDALEREGIHHSFLLHPGNHRDESWSAIMDIILENLLLGLAP